MGGACLQPLAGMTDMGLAVDMSDLHGRLIQALAEGRYCSGCALDRFLWLAEQAPIPRLSRAMAAKEWLEEFEGRFPPEDKARLAKDGKCKICRRPRASKLRIGRALALN
jgi:hypothetical protein